MRPIPSHAAAAHP